MTSPGSPLWSAGCRRYPDADHARREGCLRVVAKRHRQAGRLTSVLLDRQGRPVELSGYRGKPPLVTFIYTANFQVCPIITRNLQKAVDNTVYAFSRGPLQRHQHRPQSAL
ncbi:MAG: SCO family protein [Candidatus Accumulibacter sp.]|nr:SCO family protein [Candidatus Accumulibacter propinquus]